MSTSRYNVGQVITIRDGEAFPASARERFNVHRKIKQAIEKIPPAVRQVAAGAALATAALAGGVVATTTAGHYLVSASQPTQTATAAISTVQSDDDNLIGEEAIRKMATKLGLLSQGPADPSMPSISLNERITVEAHAALHRKQYQDLLALVVLAVAQADVTDPDMRDLVANMTFEVADYYYKHGNPSTQLQTVRFISDLERAGLTTPVTQTLKNNLVEEFVASATPDQLVEFVDDVAYGTLRVLDSTADTVLTALVVDGHENNVLRALNSDWVLKNAPLASSQAIEAIIETGSPEAIERVLHLEGRVQLSPELVELGIDRLIESGESNHLVYAVAAVIHNDLLNKTIDFDRVFDVVAQSEHYVDQMDFAHIAFRYLSADQLQKIEQRVFDEATPNEIVTWVNRIEGADHTAAFHALARKTQVMPSAEAVDTLRSFSDAVRHMRRRSQVQTEEARIEHGDDPLAHKGQTFAPKPLQM